MAERHNLFDGLPCYMSESVPKPARDIWLSNGGTISNVNEKSNCKYYFCDDSHSIDRVLAKHRSKLPHTECDKKSSIINAGSFIIPHISYDEIPPIQSKIASPKRTPKKTPTKKTTPSRRSLNFDDAVEPPEHTQEIQPVQPNDRVNARHLSALEKQKDFNAIMDDTEDL